jgi:hypothetical protein
MTNRRHPTLLSLALAATLALLPSGASAVEGFTDTPFTRNPDGTNTRWHTHDPERPQPPRAANPVLQTTPPPAGADILFDGTEASVARAWDPVPGRKGVKKLWPVTRAGILKAAQNDLRTQKAYGDCRLHIEWRVPVHPSQGGQRGTNSGVMFGDGRYEVQILESHTNITYADGMAGAIYGQFPPLFNAALPKRDIKNGTTEGWQSYDITYTAPRFDEKGKVTKAARLHVVFNGVVVQDNQELTGDCNYRGSRPFKKHPPRLPVRLQFHNDPIQFRNIWILDLENKKE